MDSHARNNSVFTYFAAFDMTCYPNRTHIACDLLPSSWTNSCMEYDCLETI